MTSETAVSRRTVLVGAASSLASVLAGCALGPTPPRLAMACGERGGTYVQFGDLLRAVLAERGSARLDVVESGGSVDNLGHLAAREADLAIALADAVTEHDGSVVAIGRVYQNYLQCVVRADGAVRTLDDLAGRPVAVGAPGSGAAITAARVLDAAGLASGPDAVLASTLRLSDAVRALRDRTIDAFFWSGGVPIPALLGLHHRVAVTLVDLTPTLPTLTAEHPGAYALTAVRSGIYDTPGPIPAIGVSNLLLARPDLADDIAARLVDALVDDAQSLVPEESVGVQYLTASSLIDTDPLPLHAAARRRYRERYG